MIFDTIVGAHLAQLLGVSPLDPRHFSYRDVPGATRFIVRQVDGEPVGILIDVQAPTADHWQISMQRLRPASSPVVVPEPRPTGPWPLASLTLCVRDGLRLLASLDERARDTHARAVRRLRRTAYRIGEARR